MLELDELTKHQQETLDKCTAAGHSHLHLKAPAGAGKTFVAMHHVLRVLEKRADARALFVARNPALCYFIARWITAREKNPLRQLQLLGRLHVLYEPFADGVRAVQLKGGRLSMEQTSHETEYALMVVDESHHIYKDSQKALRDVVEHHVHKKKTQRLLISDISQVT